MTNPSRKHVLVLVLLCLMAIPDIHRAIATTSLAGDWPVGFLIVTRRVDLQEEDPFVECSNASLDFAPFLREVLDNASYWAQQNMNETQHWLQTDFDRDLVFSLLAAHYVAKYGVNASQYAAAHNTTFANPVVKYLEFYFLFLEYRDLGHVIPFLITHVYLQTGDPYIDWNCSDLEGPVAASLGEALETAVAWAEHGVEEIVHYFDADIYHSLTRRFDYAYEHKYGLDAFAYYRAYNTTFFEPAVVYDDHYFRFRTGMPDTATTPTLPNWTSLFILLVVSLGLGLLTITVADFLRLRPRLAQYGPDARAHTSSDAPDE